MQWTEMQTIKKQKNIKNNSSMQWCEIDGWHTAKNVMEIKLAGQSWLGLRDMATERTQQTKVNIQRKCHLGIIPRN